MLHQLDDLLVQLRSRKVAAVNGDEYPGQLSHVAVVGAQDAPVVANDQVHELLVNPLSLLLVGLERQVLEPQVQVAGGVVEAGAVVLDDFAQGGHRVHGRNLLRGLILHPGELGHPGKQTQTVARRLAHVSVPALRILENVRNQPRPRGDELGLEVLDHVVTQVHPHCNVVRLALGKVGDDKLEAGVVARLHELVGVVLHDDPHQLQKGRPVLLLVLLINLNRLELVLVQVLVELALAVPLLHVGRLLYQLQHLLPDSAQQVHAEYARPGVVEALGQPLGAGDEDLRRNADVLAVLPRLLQATDDGVHGVHHDVEQHLLGATGRLDGELLGLDELRQSVQGPLLQLARQHVGKDRHERRHSGHNVAVVLLLQLLHNVTDQRERPLQVLHERGPQPGGPLGAHQKRHVLLLLVAKRLDVVLQVPQQVRHDVGQKGAEVALESRAQPAQGLVDVLLHRVVRRGRLLHDLDERVHALNAVVQKHVDANGHANDGHALDGLAAQGAVLRAHAVGYRVLHKRHHSRVVGAEVALQHAGRDGQRGHRLLAHRPVGVGVDLEQQRLDDQVRQRQQVVHLHLLREVYERRERVRLHPRTHVIEGDNQRGDDHLEEVLLHVGLVVQRYLPDGLARRKPHPEVLVLELVDHDLDDGRHPLLHLFLAQVLRRLGNGHYAHEHVLPAPLLDELRRVRQHPVHERAVLDVLECAAQPVQPLLAGVVQPLHIVVVLARLQPLRVAVVLNIQHGVHQTRDHPQPEVRDAQRHLGLLLRQRHQRLDGHAPDILVQVRLGVLRRCYFQHPVEEGPDVRLQHLGVVVDDHDQPRHGALQVVSRRALRRDRQLLDVLEDEGRGVSQLRRHLQNVVLQHVGDGAYGLRPHLRVLVQEAGLGQLQHIPQVRREVLCEVREALPQQLEPRLLVGGVCVLNQLDGAPGQLRPLIRLQRADAEVRNRVARVVSHGFYRLILQTLHHRLFEKRLGLVRHSLPHVLRRVPRL
ncbi:fatty acid desaturase, putative [Babesia caballi]|uniref:Fatty acid desaturase, putative n=1 Tax=Babesia caballi TaxID=5871 RepID=A0AAV4M1M7_BABCB|nr:fatty acid desaturase, putative [Babesia caballi]